MDMMKEIQRICNSTEFTNEDKRKKLKSLFQNDHNALPLFPANNYAVKMRNLARAEWSSDDPLAIIYDHVVYEKLDILPMTTEQFVFPLNCIGYVWLFDSSRRISESKPNIDKLIGLLLAQPHEKPAVSVNKAGSYYLVTDGCHRIYSAFLTDQPIKIEVYAEYGRSFPTVL